MTAIVCELIEFGNENKGPEVCSSWWRPIAAVHTAKAEIVSLG